ncbi:von Willebrand factor d and egf domain-containing protein [Plakobranchus ocellatus]|uniref:von Willebrand factor d and egf domain-containing protein n=1 Tax=Plakobranchus ocellatus TaxID=259542 RepID=A0AAV3YMM3_9GAST|nr:von Willebrand factor d and egf domain-containing protein [Plakobranchus ocellatus]
MFYFSYLNESVNSGSTTTPAVAATTTATIVKTTPLPTTVPTPTSPSTNAASTTPKWVPVCDRALGMRDSSIRPGQLSASSSIPGHGTEMSRAGCCQGTLFYDPGAAHGNWSSFTRRMEDGAWCADPADPDPWIQMTLSSPMAIAAVSFQVPERVDKTVIPANYVKTIRLEYRVLTTNNASMATFGSLPVTKNATVAYMATLKPIIVTDLVRMHVTDATGNACIRFELQGCDPDDLCAPKYCQNNGTCIGENLCKCTDGYYGNRCELTKNQIILHPARFLTMTNNTITTTNNSITLTAHGNVTLVSAGNNTKIVQLAKGGAVTLPTDPCIQNPDKCVSGFTVIVEVSLVNISEDQVFIATSSTGHKTSSQGLTLVYDRVKHKITFQVVTGTHTWTVNATFTWQPDAWHNVTVTFSPSLGITLIVDGLLLGGKTGVKTAPRSPNVSAVTKTTPSGNAIGQTTPTTAAPMTVSTTSQNTPSLSHQSTAFASASSHKPIPSGSLVAGKTLCLGCIPGSVVTNAKNSTTTILVMSVLTVHVHLTDLQRAGLTTVKKSSKPKVTCHSTKLDFNFLNMTDTNTEVVTSLGTYKSYGNVTVEREDRNVLLVLDSQGEYVEVSNTGHPCVDDITACTSNLTYRLVFRFLDFHIEPNFLLSSGGDLLNSTGISLYYFHGKFNFWVKDGVWVWRAIYDVTLDLDRWYTIDASWSHVTGIELSLDGIPLPKIINSTHKADYVTEKHPLHIARSPSPEKNMTSLIEVLIFRVWTKTVDELKALGCGDDLKIKNPVDRCKTNMTEVKFEEVLRGHDLVTSLGTMAIHGNVSVEQTLFQQGQVVLVLNQEGDYVDMGTTGITCLDDVTSCTGSFNFRITFLLREISQIPNYIISSGGELLNSTGVSLYYHNGQLRFWVKRGRQTDRKIFNYKLSDYVWYTLDASWDSTDGSITVFIDGTEISGQQLFSTPTPPTTLLYPVHLGKSPGKDGTTKMNILLFRFWERTRTELVKQGCNKTLAVYNPPNPPAPTTSVAPPTTSVAPPTTSVAPPTTSVAPPTTTFMTPASTQATVQTKVVFKEIKGTTLVTTYINMTIHGSVTLQYVPAGQILVIEKPDAYVDIGKTGVPCLDDVTSCSTGFNFRLIFTLTSFTNRTQVLVSNGADKDAKAGVAVVYQNNSIVVYVKRPNDNLVGTFPCTLSPGYWYTVDVTWKAQGSLDVHLNNLLLSGKLTISKVIIQLTATYSLLLGKSPGDVISTSMRVFEIDLWTQVYTRIKREQLQLPKLDNYNITTPQPRSTTLPTTPKTSILSTEIHDTPTSATANTTIEASTLPTTITIMSTTTATTTTSTSPATTTLPIPGDCNVQDLDPHAKLAYNLTFLRVAQPDNLVVTPDSVLRAYGDPHSGSQTNTLGQAVTVDGTNDALELECVPCISNLLNCDTGFTLQVDVNMTKAVTSIEAERREEALVWNAVLETERNTAKTDPSASVDTEHKKSFPSKNSRSHVAFLESKIEDSATAQFRAASSNRMYILDSIEDSTRDMGLELFCEAGKLHVTLQADKGKWIIETPYILQPNTLYRLQVSWKPTGNLDLFVNNFLVSAGRKVSLPRVNYYQPRPLLLGRARNGQQDFPMSLSELFIWMTTRDILQQKGLVAGFLGFTY